MVKMGVIPGFHSLWPTYVLLRLTHRLNASGGISTQACLWYVGKCAS